MMALAKKLVKIINQLTNNDTKLKDLYNNKGLFILSSHKHYNIFASRLTSLGLDQNDYVIYITNYYNTVDPCIHISAYAVELKQQKRGASEYVDRNSRGIYLGTWRRAGAALERVD